MTNANTIIEDAHRSIARKMAERREYELRGAWRAGYDYVHVFRPGLSSLPLARDGPTAMLPAPQRDLAEILHVPQDVLIPSNSNRPGAGPGRYCYTYDLTSVPDDVLRAAIRGDLDPEEWDG